MTPGYGPWHVPPPREPMDWRPPAGAPGANHPTVASSLLAGAHRNPELCAMTGLEMRVLSSLVRYS